MTGKNKDVLVWSIAIGVIDEQILFYIVMR